MARLKKYNLSGQQLGEVAVSKDLVDAEAHSQLIKDYIIALRANQRQWSASTKTRSEVKHTTRKCGPQKGSGNARHGSDVAPQYRGGGRAHGPRPKFDQHVRINKKERRLALRALLADKIRTHQLLVVDSLSMEKPRTRDVAAFLRSLDLQGRVLFLGDSALAEVANAEDVKTTVHVSSEQHDNFSKSLRNIPKTQFLLTGSLSGYDVVAARTIVMTEEALRQIEEWLCTASQAKR